jgi:hypothetical protein
MAATVADCFNVRRTREASTGFEREMARRDVQQKAREARVSRNCHGVEPIGAPMARLQKRNEKFCAQIVD